MSRNSVCLSRGDRDLRVAFKFHAGSHASSRVEAMNSTLLYSWHGYLLEPSEWPKGSQASCGVLRGDKDCSLGPAEKNGLNRNDGVSHGFSRAVAQRMGFLSSYDGELREPLVWPQGSPVSI